MFSEYLVVESVSQILIFQFLSYLPCCPTSQDRTPGKMLSKTQRCGWSYFTVLGGHVAHIGHGGHVAHGGHDANDGPGGPGGSDSRDCYGGHDCHDGHGCHGGHDSHSCS